MVLFLKELLVAAPRSVCSQTRRCAASSAGWRGAALLAGRVPVPRGYMRRYSGGGVDVEIEEPEEPEEPELRSMWSSGRSRVAAASASRSLAAWCCEWTAFCCVDFRWLWGWNWTRARGGRSGSTAEALVGECPNAFRQLGQNAR